MLISEPSAKEAETISYFRASADIFGEEGKAKDAAYLTLMRIASGDGGLLRKRAQDVLLRVSALAGSGLTFSDDTDEMPDAVAATPPAGAA